MSRLTSYISGNPMAGRYRVQRRPTPAEIQLRLATLQTQLDRETRQDSSRRGDQRFQLLVDAIKDGQRASSEAKQANLDRYHDVLGLYGVTRGDVLGDLENFGGSQRSDINRRWDTSRNNLITDLAERGLAGSTARIPIEASTNEGRGRELERLDDALRERRANVKTGFADRAGGVMERRTDSYPDLSNLSSIAGLIGQLDEPPMTTYGLDAITSLQSLIPQMSAQAPVERVGRRASLPGTRQPVYAQQAAAPVENAADRSRQDQMAQQELQRRKLMVAMKNARESRGGVPGGAIGAEREAQNAAIRAGAGDWSAGQRAPTIPGAPYMTMMFGMAPRKSNWPP